MDTNIDRLGNSVGEKEEIVNNIKNPPIIVAFKVTRLFESISKSIWYVQLIEFVFRQYIWKHGVIKFKQNNYSLTVPL